MTCYVFVRFEVLTAVALLDACFKLVSLLPYFLALKMDVIYSSETLVAFHRTTPHYVPEDRTPDLFYARYICRTLFTILHCHGVCD
jgi:hypothetical protein